MSKQKGIFRSALDALIEARMARANREIAQHRIFDKRYDEYTR
jgi:hypothetical protein